jgi:MoaA/NifB/PqqE/SkfB family radical SAM enzyme
MIPRVELDGFDSAACERARQGALAFDELPILVFSETTKACLLRCRHCRTTALRELMPREICTL